MRLLPVLAILGFLLWSGMSAAGAATPSDWPSLGANAAQSNFNAAETALTTKNVRKLKVKWTAPIPDISYPVVAGGRVYVPQQKGKAVHAEALDILTGKPVATFSKGALGGMLVNDGKLYLAGHTLEILDATSGEKDGEVKGPSTSKAATFTYPIADSKVVLAGYASASKKIANRVYAIDPASGTVLWHSPSQNAQGAIAAGRVLTLTSTGTIAYGESSGKAVTSATSLLSDWFGAGDLALTVASASNHNVTLFAYDTSGHSTWSRTVGPRMDPRGWAHAATPEGVYVAMLKPYEGLEALNPSDGSVQWKVRLPGIQRLAAANGMVFALSNEMGMPLRLAVYRADTGKAVATLSLSSGYFAFSTSNELMIAGGMVFIRAVGPGGPTLVALAP
jgi:outer membrane protein assembly factor BamB